MDSMQQNMLLGDTAVARLIRNLCINFATVFACNLLLLATSVVC